MTVPAIVCSGLWKIFGTRKGEALAAARDRGFSKRQVLEEFDCVLGVADVSFSVEPGEIFCIMGLSGSGKSTLVRHLNRLIEPTAGEVRIGGNAINKLSPSELRTLRSETVGMVFQHMALLPHRNVYDNVSLSLELRGKSRKECRRVAEENLKLVELSGWGERYPDELSGGMKQRVGLARAMAADPQILLLDEPFSALDPLIRRQLQQQFLDLAEVVQKTTVFITHDLDEAICLGDRIAIMKDGKFVQVGTPEDIVTAPKDRYVADFVSGISLLNLVTARKIMQPRDSIATLSEKKFQALPRVQTTDKLSAVISTAADGGDLIAVYDGGEPAGIVTRRALFSGIQGVISSPDAVSGLKSGKVCQYGRSSAPSIRPTRPGRSIDMDTAALSAHSDEGKK
ncbi:MAG: ATP-binding cassette domain-containing protein [Mesorhizobium sp.]|uniref:quaternary amine ABC transporter ATP-binding protein n=7 Tax=Mesorhizobium TaxID=68287 RepID=UPI000FCC1F4C|nr:MULTISPECIES: betaine/proline/choline family ABC transporter ATP-binding protein [unclassified Mesorhizobium]MCQ8876404.1 betaine/proline/choline family ABC transporter ATP-binding protein [Mesorhizobium sp. LMG17149]MCT2580984.1 betaine/proline/choline family ABC transporter ATP-binding protein [Mesorhizobium sp. P13.3]MDF3169751.1 betaine/proline/choline family ABC transporter ATP-binding protein [Mesorhizobium sp. P16.1]MDF3180583.1 betaine/proline/choline family ABC transporter ATP-bindi